MFRPAADAIIVNPPWSKHASGIEERPFSSAHSFEIPSPSIEAKREYDRQYHHQRQRKVQQKSHCKRDPKIYPNPDKLIGQKPFGIFIQC